MFVKKDATYSSQIEGTRATLQDVVSEVVTQEKSHLSPDVDDIVHYVMAINYGIERIKDLPLSLRMIREVHRVLMEDARATQFAYPGEFRTSQNWIGGTTLQNAAYVPPAVNDMKLALNDLEKFIHADDDYPSLIKAGLIHAQFETTTTIYRFTDGNGRTGRMLIALFIHHSGDLELPVLYLSNYFKKYQKIYYQKLQGYHDEDSQLNEWLEFFLDGVIETAKSSIETCAQITDLRDRDFSKVQRLGNKSAGLTLEIIRNLFGQPIIGIAEAIKWTGFSRQGSYDMINRLIEMKILEPLGDANYGQKYIYADYYEVFDEVFKEHRKNLSVKKKK